MRFKGIFIVLLSLVLLTGCREEEKIIEEVNYFKILESEIDVCQDDCNDSYSDFNILLIEDYKQMADEVILGIDPNPDDYNYIHNDVMVDRSDITILDKINSDRDIPINTPNLSIQEKFDRMSSLLEYCTEVACNIFPELSEELYNIDFFDIGFDDSSGFFELIVNYGDEFYSYESFYYSFANNDLQFESTSYIPSSNLVEYAYMKDGIYREIEIYNDEYFALKYVDINTYDSFYLYHNTGFNLIKFYDSNKELLYYYTNSDSFTTYSIKSYRDMEYVAMLEFSNDEKTYGLNFHFMSGWDTLYKNDSNVSFYVDLYNEGELVFEEFDVFLLRYNLAYNRLDFVETIEEDKYELLEFPEEFNGNITMDQLRSELEIFIQLSNPFEITGMTYEELVIKINEMANNIIED